MMASVKEQLEEWASGTARAYAQIARSGNPKENVAFYTQSDLSACVGNPKTLILGINPGSAGPYVSTSSGRGQIDKPFWELDGKDMDGCHLLKGNPSWCEKEAWPYWKRLCGYFKYAGENPLFHAEDCDVVVSNATFFATKEAVKLSSGILKRTFPYTLELIDILKPQMILLESGLKHFPLLKSLRLDKLSVEYSQLPCAIQVGSINGIPCYGVPHPSAHLSHEQREAISRFVSYVYDTHTLDLEEIKRHVF